ncbi:MAG: DivIVA protein [Jatrophihabitans sp.]|jgi:DivIVA domain-containing protein|nr:DivIVA protein [Jatrophihabitans sp.]
MPLTPAEVHNVAFKKPPIGKRGYDEEEVDAFLDIVEVELSRLIEENNDLRSRLGSGQPAPAAAAASGADPAELAAVRDENGRLQGRISELERTLSQGKNGAQQQVVQLQQQLAQTEQQLNENRLHLEQAQNQLAEAQQAGAANLSKDSAAPSTSDHHLQAVQMLALAQQTADQHLSQSKAEAERLVTEAQANAQATVADANDKSTRQLADAENRAKALGDESAARAAQSIQDAEQRAATITAQFEQRKAALERRVEELRTFEREYRTRLKSYLESQLRDLDASGKSEPATPNSDYADVQQG